MAGRVYPSGECRNCGMDKPIMAHGWCGMCNQRWKRAGKPADMVVPPPVLVRDKEGHLADTRLMILTGIRDMGRLAELVGVRRGTMRRYLHELGEQRLIPPRGRPEGWRKVA